MYRYKGTKQWISEVEKKHVDTSSEDKRERKQETMLDWQNCVWYATVIPKQ